MHPENQKDSTIKWFIQYVIVPIVVAFIAGGGWYVKVCIPNNIQISSEDVGRIQADWLGKRYGMDNHTWKVIVK